MKRALVIRLILAPLAVWALWASPVLGQASGSSEEKGTMGNWRERKGEQLVMVGRVSQTPWQHMIQTIPGKTAYYVDLAVGGQVVAYASGNMECKGQILLWAKVVLAEGTSKRPGDTKSFTEAQLDVNRWACADEKGIRSLLDRMADQTVAQAEKEQLEDVLVQLGMDAIPVLIGSVGDQRVCWKEKRLLNEAELTNAPVSRNPPPRSGSKPTSRWAAAARASWQASSHPATTSRPTGPTSNPSPRGVPCSESRTGPPGGPETRARPSIRSTRR